VEKAVVEGEKAEEKQVKAVVMGESQREVGVVEEVLEGVEVGDCLP
jgi:hypothetical protein